MNPNTFKTTYEGEHVPDNEGGYVGECVSLAKRFAQEVQGVPNADLVLQVPFGAQQLYTGFNWNGLMAQYYDKIPYGQPRQVYDLVVWGTNKGQYGDVAIAWDEKTTVFGQLGTPVFQVAQLRNDIDKPLGYLRRKVNKKMTDQEIDEVIAYSFEQVVGKSPTDVDFNTYRPLIKNNNGEGIIQMHKNFDAQNIVKWKNMPTSNVVPYEGPTLFQEKS